MKSKALFTSFATVFAALALNAGCAATDAAASSPTAEAVKAPADPAANAASAKPEEIIAKAMKVKPSEVKPSPIPGMYEVNHDHDFGFASADGKYFIHGDMLNTASGANLTEDARRADRVAALAALGESNTIEFAPAPPIAEKYIITVFTDVDCGYCRRMHSQIDDYNKLGITVRYAFFPRSGPNTDSWSKAEAVWCSSDRKAAFTKAKQGVRVSSHQCTNPVNADFNLGYQLGVRGTPMIFFQNGEEVPGYLPPNELVQELAKADPSSVPTSAKMDPPIGAVN